MINAGSSVRKEFMVASSLPGLRCNQVLPTSSIASKEITIGSEKPCRPFKSMTTIRSSFGRDARTSSTLSTAPYFTESYGEKEWRDEIAYSQAAGRDLSLYVHIPFCDTLCYY